MIEIAAIFLGLLCGLVVGLTGVGATLLLLPVLLFGFSHLFPASLAVKMTIVTTLACTAVTVAYATVMHVRKRNINYRLLGRLIIIYFITAGVGAFVVHVLPARLIELVLGVVLIVIAWRTLCLARRESPIRHSMPFFAFVAVSILAGFSNSICGVGTGNILIPFLSRYQPYRKAVGTSVAGAACASIFASIAYIAYSLHIPGLPPYTLGYLYLPVFFLVSLGALIATPIGIALSEYLQLIWIKYVLVAMVFCSGVFAIVHCQLG